MSLFLKKFRNDPSNAFIYKHVDRSRYFRYDGPLPNCEYYDSYVFKYMYKLKAREDDRCAT